MAFVPPPRKGSKEPGPITSKDPRALATGDRRDTDEDDVDSPKSQDDELPFWEESDFVEEKPFEKELDHDSRLLEAPAPARRHTAPSLSLRERSFPTPTPSTRPGTASAQSSPSFQMSPKRSDRPSKSRVEVAEKSPASESQKGPKWLQVPSFRPAAAAAVAVSGYADRLLVETLCISMRRFRGTSMKAWRCDFDKHGVGWVSRAEFARGCRFYGCPADAIWTSCHNSGGAGMKFWELDTEEALDLELFEQVLWIRTGFDLRQTWAILDPHNQTALTLQEFVRGCRALGFDGDAHHIFKGLDHQGLGRVSWHDFEYLQKLCDTSSCAKNFTFEFRLLRSWAVEVCADMMELLKRLSLIDEHAGGWAQCTEPIEVQEFIHRLEALDYPGDPAELAGQVCKAPTLLTRTGTVQRISAEHVCSALFGKQIRRADGPPNGKHDLEKSDKSDKVSDRVKKKNPIRKAEWDSSIWSGYRSNMARPAALRTYFSTPAKEPQVKQGRITRASSNPVLSRSQPRAKERQSKRSVSPGSEPRRVRPGELNHR